MIINTDYDKIFNNHLVVITGTTRSGTTIVERLVGSMKDCYTLFEPVCFPNILTLMKKGLLDYDNGKQLLQNILFEDLFLQKLHGRTWNFNKRNDTYFKNYKDIMDIKNQWDLLDGRKDVIRWMETNDYILVVKNPNLQPLLSLINNLFLGVKFIIVYRNKNDTIGSNIRKGFYSDENITDGMVDCWCENYYKNIDDDVFAVPYYIDDKDFIKKDHKERCISVFDTLKELEEKFVAYSYSNILLVDFDKLKDYTEYYIKGLEKFLFTQRTDSTVYVTKKMESYKQRKYKKIKEK